MNRSAAKLLGFALLAAWYGASYAGSAINDLVRAAGGGAGSVPNVPSPTCVANCGPYPSGKVSVPRSSVSRSYGYNPSLDIGSAVLGSLLSSVLFAPEQPSGPSPEELRRQEEARRKAEAEARKRAAEEQARHKRLVASLKSVPLPRTYSAEPGAQGTTDIQLKSLSTLQAMAEPSAHIKDGDLEKLRSDASLGFDTASAADMRFAIRFQPMPVSQTAFQPVYRPFCQNRQCTWPADPGSALPRVRVSASAGGATTLGQDDIVRMLSAPGAKGKDAGTVLINGIMTGGADAQAVQGRYVIDERLKRFSTNAGKELAKTWFWLYVAQVFDEAKTVQRGIDLIHKVYELADQDMNDAIKAAKWLGSDQIDGAPELTSVEDASLPFVQSALDASPVFGGQVTSLVTTGIDAHSLAFKLKSLWEKGE